METNEPYDQISPVQELVLNAEAQNYLREAGKWAVFLGILGFILTGFLLLAAFFVGAIFSLVANYQQTPYPAGMGGIVSIVYIFIAVFYFFFSLYLFQFGSRIKRGILFSDSMAVSTGLGKLKSFFKLWGITTIVILAFYALIIILVVVVGITTSSLLHR